MIIDKQNLFSEAQAVTASAASTNVIDLGATDSKIQPFHNKGGGFMVNAQVVENFNNLTSLKVGLQTANDEAFSSPDTVLETTVVLASLKAGYIFPLSVLPEGMKRYVRLYYTVTGTAPTTGKMTAGLVLDKQTNGF